FRYEPSLSRQMRSKLLASTTAVHLAMSSTMRARNSSGVVGRGSLPSARRRSTTVGSLRMATTSALKRSTIPRATPARARKPVPPPRRVARNPGRGGGGAGGRCEKALPAGDRERAQPAVPDEFDERRRRVHHEVEAFADEIERRRRATAVGHVLEMHLRLFGQQLAPHSLTHPIAARPLALPP